MKYLISFRKCKLAPYKKTKADEDPFPEIQIKCPLKALRPVTVETVPRKTRPFGCHNVFGLKRTFGVDRSYRIYGIINNKNVAVRMKYEIQIPLNKSDWKIRTSTELNPEN